MILIVCVLQVLNCSACNHIACSEISLRMDLESMIRL